LLLLAISTGTGLIITLLLLRDGLADSSFFIDFSPIAISREERMTSGTWYGEVSTFFLSL
jgi:hypothetical protein